jgi:hypothetical protein
MNTNETPSFFISGLIFGGMILVAILYTWWKNCRQLASLKSDLDAQLGDEIRETTACIYAHKEVCPLARAQVQRASEHFNNARRLGHQGASDKEVVVLLRLGLDQVSHANTSAAMFRLQSKTRGRVPPSLQDLATWNSEPHEYAVLTSASGLEADFKYAGGLGKAPPTVLLTLAQGLAVAAQFEVGHMLAHGEDSPAKTRVVNVRTGQVEQVFAPASN